MFKKNNMLHSWYMKSLLDWVTIGALASSLIFTIVLEEWIPHHNTCLPGYDKDSEGNFICGEIRNPLWEKPIVELSVTSFGANMIGLTPFIIVFLFNLLVWNIPVLKNKLIPQKVQSNLYINTSLLRWFDVMARCLLSIGGMTTLFVHILKFTIGLPRPNAYALLDNNGAQERLSFVSGHTAIAYTYAWLFGVLCSKSINYCVSRNMILPNQERHQEEEHFNGNYWFLLPLWQKLSYVPSLCYMLAWAPICGATYVGVTRITEYWHSDIDCVAGALVGIFCAHFFGYLRYYNELYGVKVHNLPETVQRETTENNNDSIINVL